MDVERGTTSRLTFDPERHNTSPVWTRDGQRVLYSTFRPKPAIYEKAASGGDAREVHVSKSNQSLPWTTSTDGTLVLGQGGAGQRADIFRMPLSGGTPAPVVVTSASELFPQLSPDGRWLAFTSDESGRNEVFIQSFPGSGTKLQVSTTGGQRARWRSDGRELYYRQNQIAGPPALMAVAVEADGTGLKLSKPQALFSAILSQGVHEMPFSQYAVQPTVNDSSWRGRPAPSTTRLERP